MPNEDNLGPGFDPNFEADFEPDFEPQLEPNLEPGIAIMSEYLLLDYEYDHATDREDIDEVRAKLFTLQDSVYELREMIRLDVFDAMQDEAEARFRGLVEEVDTIKPHQQDIFALHRCAPFFIKAAFEALDSTGSPKISKAWALQIGKLFNLTEDQAMSLASSAQSQVLDAEKRSYQLEQDLLAIEKGENNA